MYMLSLTDQAVDLVKGRLRQSLAMVPERVLVGWKEGREGRTEMDEGDRERKIEGEREKTLFDVPD